MKYGLRDGQLVNIDSVSNGLSCGCVCPNCGGRLSAHQGQKKEHHFKHYKVADCKQGAETALHILAKQIIYETKTIFIPNAPINAYDTEKHGKCYKFKEAFVERQLSPDVRSDVYLTSGNVGINVEIKVTHQVDDNKHIQLFNEQIRTIEIDLSDMIEDYNESSIKKSILDGRHTSLLYSPSAREVYARWLLGEWKKVHNDRSRCRYVEYCPKSGKIAYFESYSYLKDSGSCDCHECNCFFDYNGDSTFLLCYGICDHVDFSGIEKIVDLQKEKGHIKFAKLVINGKEQSFGSKAEIVL